MPVLLKICFADNLRGAANEKNDLQAGTGPLNSPVFLKIRQVLQENRGYRIKNTVFFIFMAMGTMGPVL